MPQKATEQTDEPETLTPTLTLEEITAIQLFHELTK